MGKEEPTKKKAIKKATKASKSAKRGDNKKKHKTHTDIKFNRPKTLALKRKSKYAAQPKSAVRSDKFSYVRYPLSTEKAMKKMEDENTMVFIVDNKLTKNRLDKLSHLYITSKLRALMLLTPQKTRKKPI